MTSKIATVANLALHTFQQHSLRAAAMSSTNNSASTPDVRENSRNSNDTPSKRHVSSISLSDTNSLCTESLQKLMASMCSLTPKDVGFDANWVSDSNVYAAPVAYVHITENETFWMGMFILRPGSRIPLHDHPGMFGVLRVLHGSVRCRSFSQLQNVKPAHEGFRKSTLSDFHWQFSDLIVACPQQDIVLTPESPALFLSPTYGNLHEITPVDSPAVFLDILAPPYDHDLGTRECRFYREVNIPQVLSTSNDLKKLNGTASPTTTVPSVQQNSEATSQSSSNHILEEANGFNSGSSVIYLVETYQPKDYWCESAEYMGPKVT